MADSYGAEKIRTIGDACMVVVGLPTEQRNHAEVAVDLERDMRTAVRALDGQTHFDVRLRFGVNSGPVVAGVIGRRKFAFDLWGDAVNAASWTESNGTADEILMTETTAHAVPVFNLT